MLQALIDSGIIVAFYNVNDKHHAKAVQFYDAFPGQLITTVGCVTEVMYLLWPDVKSQNVFMNHLVRRFYVCEHLHPEDFARIAELNSQYADLPGDFADLALVSISERLNIAEIVTLDKDFDIYRRYRNQPFNRIFRP
ncbi:MAG: VapC toxin family PIN domain ribonuclease [Cyanobacteria bacterium J06634_6]